MDLPSTKYWGIHPLAVAPGKVISRYKDQQKRHNSAVPGITRWEQLSSRIAVGESFGAWDGVGALHPLVAELLVTSFQSHRFFDGFPIHFFLP